MCCTNRTNLASCHSVQHLRGSSLHELSNTLDVIIAGVDQLGLVNCLHRSYLLAKRLLDFDRILQLFYLAIQVYRPDASHREAN